MRLGLLTAPFPRRSLKHVAEWASGEGFEMLEVACWPSAGGCTGAAPAATAA